jgi:hypothetical protein
MGKGARAVLLVAVVATVWLLAMPLINVLERLDDGRTSYRTIVTAAAVIIVMVGVLWIGRGDD